MVECALLGGSWVVINGLISNHEPPSNPPSASCLGDALPGLDAAEPDDSFLRGWFKGSRVQGFRV